MSWNFIVLPRWNNSPQIDMLPPLGHLILILSKPVFALSPYRCILSGEATNINFIVIGLTRSGLEPTIYHIWGRHANHYTTDAYHLRIISQLKLYGLTWILFYVISIKNRLNLCFFLKHVYKDSRKCSNWFDLNNIISKVRTELI